MNIIYTGAFRFPDKDAASQRVLSNAKAARAAGHNVIFCGWEQNDNQSNKLKEGFRYYSQAELDIITKNPMKKLYNYLYRGFKTLRWLADYICYNKIDIIIIYNSGYYFTKKVMDFGRANNIEIIVDCTEWYQGSHLPGGIFGIVNIENNLRMRYLLPKVKNIIVISSYLEKFYIDKKCNVLKIPPLVDLSDNKWSKNQLSPNKFGNRKVLIYAGDPGKKDIFNSVLEALKVVNNTELKIIFILVGISENEFKKKLGLREAPSFVRCVGRVRMEDVPAYYRSASYSILIRENKRYANAGFSTKLVESLSFGVPVITNNTSDIKNYISNENGYIQEVLSLKELIAIFNSIISESKDDYLKKSSKAHETSKNFFHYENYTPRLANYLSGLSENKTK
jgi:glycosyltransferase involved in cell wall biosynthesis